MGKNSELLSKGQRKTLADKTSEVNAKVYIYAKDDLQVIPVDHVLVGEADMTRKCDFMILGLNSDKTHFIELKGAVIDEAFGQIADTIYYLLERTELKRCVDSRRIMDAYIASPDRQKVPAVHSLQEKKLAKMLYSLTIRSAVYFVA